MPLPPELSKEREETTVIGDLEAFFNRYASPAGHEEITKFQIFRGIEREKWIKDAFSDGYNRIPGCS